MVIFDKNKKQVKELWSTQLWNLNVFIFLVINMTGGMFQVLIIKLSRAVENT